jgi:collagenase-like PrtC family protease
MDYCVTRCTLERFRDASQFIKSRWIRPEDIPIYEETGIDFFKIAGRAMPSEWIINATAAYPSRQYQGNLRDILYVPDPKIEYAGPTSPSIEIARIGSPPKVYIDNQSLQGFIDFFKKQDCLSGCAHCDYCQKTADKVVQLDYPELDEYVSVSKSFLNDLTSNRIFLAKKY